MLRDGDGLFTDAEWDELTGALSLTPRQQQISRCIARDMSDIQVAQAMGISIPTVRTHLRRIFDKLDVEDRTGLVVRLMTTFRQRRGELPGC